MSKTYRVTSSPYEEDDDLPWDYDEDGFISWVDEVFLEGYKGNDPMPTIDEALEIVESNGYELAIF